MYGLNKEDIRILHEIAEEKKERERIIEEEKSSKIYKIVSDVLKDDEYREHSSFYKSAISGEYIFVFSKQKTKHNYICYFVEKYVDKIPVVSKKTVKKLKKIAEIIYDNNWEDIIDAKTI
jgi:hypothetical protein